MTAWRLNTLLVLTFAAIVACLWPPIHNPSRLEVAVGLGGLVLLVGVAAAWVISFRTVQKRR